MYFIVFSVFTAIVIGVGFFLYKRQTHLSEIPKPPCNLILGHLLEFRDRTKILEKLTNFSNQYDGMYRIYIPPTKPGIVITDNKILQALALSGAAPIKSSFYHFLKDFLGDGLLLREGENWKSWRRILNPCFSRPSLLRKFIEKFESVGDVLVDKLAEQLGNPSVDISLMMRMFSMDVMCETSMGVELNCQKDSNNEYFRSVNSMCQILLERSASCLYKIDFFFHLTTLYQTQTKMVKTINDFHEKIIQEKMKEYNPASLEEPKITFLDILLDNYKTGKEISEKDIKGEVNTFMFAGHDTTATTLAFTMYCMAQHPDVQEKILEEQKCIFGDLNKELTVTYENLQDMKYLEMVVKESLRMYPPAPFMGRKVTKELKLDGGITLPKDTDIVIFVYGCHHNPKNFPEPEKFIPERFERDDITPFTFFPFGIQPRVCIGKKYAMLELKSCISKIVRNFLLLPARPQHKVVLVPALVLNSINGIKISLERRC
ncbi:hypothetical protein JTB14_005176 [Gonioctena quinquepunctata]|nr:hypothetical protein JTB14_005176 [Gonioctena quinquepunctata]